MDGEGLCINTCCLRVSIAILPETCPTANVSNSKCVVMFLVQVTPLQANPIRETIICGIEDWGKRLRQEGASEACLDGIDPQIRRISEGVNIPLMYELAWLADHVDLECIEFFRTGEFV